MFYRTDPPVVSMYKRAIAINGVAIMTGSALIYASFAANPKVSDTGAPRPVLDTLVSPAFLVPSIIIAVCVIVVVIIITRRAMIARRRSTQDPTGFRVGKKTTVGTRVNNPTDGDVDVLHDADILERSTTNEQPTGFRVGKKTSGGTRVSNPSGDANENIMEKPGTDTDTS
jgi:hypothetical protein